MLPLLKQALDGWPKTATVTPLTGVTTTAITSARNVLALPNGRTADDFVQVHQ